jgi:hypothetical protein
VPEHIQYEDDDLFNPETHHESSDVPIKPLFVFIVIFVVFAFFAHFLVLIMYKALAKAERTRAEAPYTEVVKPESEKIPQQPLLQPFPRKDPAGEVMPPNTNTPVTDMADMRRDEEKVLRNYGWVDKQKGIVHMPISAAKELALQRLNQPVVAPAVPPPATTTTTTGGQQQ